MNTITIDETIAATQFICRAHRVSDGVLVGEVITSAPTADLPSLSSDPVYIVVIPYQGERYQTNHAYSINDYVFPHDPITTPFYYQRVVAGTSGSVEPAWALISGGYCDDNGVINAWLAFNLIQPQIHAYMSLTPDAAVIWDGGASVWDTKPAIWTS